MASVFSSQRAGLLVSPYFDERRRRESKINAQALDLDDIRCMRMCFALSFGSTEIRGYSLSLSRGFIVQAFLVIVPVAEL